MNRKNIYDITRFTTLDYTNHLSCIVWFVKCNMRCKYCYNNALVNSNEGKYSSEYLLDFLKTRIGKLDAVVLSGGEATMHNLIPLCEKIKKMGFKIKLDTNGLNTKLIKMLISLELIDFISLDYKAHKNKFKNISGSSSYNNFLDTLKFLIKIDFSFEIRTTIHEDLLDVNDINLMIDELVNMGYKKTYYLQNFLETPTNLGGIQASKNIFDKDNLSNKLLVQWRN